jgi:mannosylglycerate hydrolase
MARLEKAAAFGGAADVGYLPDMFGHIAQMPQILKEAGFGHAVVWRGVPSVVDKTGFWWEAPDGSTVRAEYLPVGYGNGAAIPSDAKELVRRIADHVEEIGSFSSTACCS